MNTDNPITKAIDALNAAFEADPSAVWTLMNSYTTCNEALADHPTVQVIEKDVQGEKKFTVGPLGLINGVIEAISGQRICIKTSEPNADGKRKLLGFDIYKAPTPKLNSEEVIKRLDYVDAEFTKTSKDLSDSLKSV